MILSLILIGFPTPKTAWDVAQHNLNAEQHLCNISLCRQTLRSSVFVFAAKFSLISWFRCVSKSYTNLIHGDFIIIPTKTVKQKTKYSMWHWKIILCLTWLWQRKQICCFSFSIAERVNKQAHADWPKRKQQQNDTKQNMWEEKELSPINMSLRHISDSRCACRAFSTGKTPRENKAAFMCRLAGIFMCSDIFLSAWDILAKWPKQ